MQSLDGSLLISPLLFQPLSKPDVLEMVPSGKKWEIRPTQTPVKEDLYQIIEAIAKVVEAAAQDSALTLSQRLHLINRIDIIRNVADHFNQETDSDFCVSVLRILLLICTLGIFDYRESLKFKLEVALAALFPEKTDWAKTARELTVEDYFLFPEPGTIRLRLISPARTEELLSLLKLPERNELDRLLIRGNGNAHEIALRGADSILAVLEERKQNAPPLGPKPGPKKDPNPISLADQAVLAEKPNFGSLAPKEQIKALIDLYENAALDNTTLMNALKTVFATYTTAQVIESLELTSETTPATCLTLSDWLPLFSQTHWEEMPKTAFFHLVLGTFTIGGLERTGISNEKFHELYLKHDPNYSQLHSLSAKPQGTHLLFNLFPIKTTEETTKSQGKITSVPEMSLLPFFDKVTKKHATGYLARLLSPTQIQKLSDTAFLNAAATLLERGTLRPQKEDSNLCTYISRLLENDRIENIVDLLRNLYSFPFLETSSPDFLWALLEKMPLYMPNSSGSLEYINGQIHNGIGTEKWTKMLEHPKEDTVARIFKQGSLRNAADVSLFVNHLKNQQNRTCYTAYCVANGCAAYLSQTSLTELHKDLEALKEDSKAKYHELFAIELLDTPTETSIKFFSDNSHTLSTESLRLLLAEKPAPFTAHVLGAKLDTQKVILRLLNPETTDPQELALIQAIEEKDGELIKLWRAMKKEDSSYQDMHAFRAYGRISELE